jgi:curved DNA-binding protein CbpA
LLQPFHSAVRLSHRKFYIQYLSFSAMNPSTDYYTLLGVDRDATPAEIKAAFKRQALKYHPDVYKGADAHERMRQLLHAYQTLNDPHSRKDYDFASGSPVEHKQGPARSTSFQRGSASKTRSGERTYNFSIFHEGQPLYVDLEAITYTLTPNEARALVYQGMLRGVAPETAHDSYFCHRCHHNWQPARNSAKAERWDVPRRCPHCTADDWPEYLLLRCDHCHAVFESEQIRYSISGYHYGQQAGPTTLCPPYELFPLCPNCRRSHWCPAEETRVQELRRRAEQRATIQRFIWISVAVVLITVASIFLLSGVR